MVFDFDDSDLWKIRGILEEGWSEDTTHDKEGYGKKNRKSWGQCYVTARAVNHVLGWKILRCRVPRMEVDHYWSLMPNGREVDFTSDQFEGDGIHKIQGWTGKPRAFKPIEECKTINPRLKRFLQAVEGPLRRLRQLLS